MLFLCFLAFISFVIKLNAAFLLCLLICPAPNCKSNYKRNLDYKITFVHNLFCRTFASLKIVTMNNRRVFEIPFVGLKPGVHEFQYEIDDKFFIPFGEQDFTNVKAHVKLTLD